MERDTSRPMTPFDNFTTPSALYVLKRMLPCTPPQTQRILGIYIKFFELRYTFDYFYGFSSGGSPASLLDYLKDSASPEEKEMMEQAEMMMEMLRMMQSSPEASGMPDLSDLFGTMFQGEESSAGTDSQKGEEKS